MKYTLAMLVAAAAVQASPFPQAVTASIAPEASAPSGCSPNYSGTFGIAVMNLTAAAAPGPAPPVTSLPDGQPQATTGVPAVTTLPDGQPQATTGVPAVSTIADGQPQAPTQTVVPVTQISDGQIQATTMMPINQIGDGQIQNTVPAVSTIADGQPQAPTGVPAVSTIADGQPQAPTGAPAVSTIADGQPQAPTGAPAVSTIADGQPQAPTGAPAVSTIADGQPQAPTGAPAVSTIADGQPQAPTGAAVSTIADGQPQATASASAGGSKQVSSNMVACNGSSTLQVTLDNGILKDNQGRTGYIASNYQFQFDGPPQAGAIYTAGFSVCGNGSLALGGSSVFYQCLSGNFYNLYDRNWAAQCNAITINVVSLVDCP